MMEEAEEKDMDSVACFKSGKSLTITGKQDNVHSKSQMKNLLASSNRYGYIFYATETDGLKIIPSTYIDRESIHLSKSSEDDDVDDDNEENQNLGETSIIHRSYIPGLSTNKNSSFLPCWISLNADESILAIVLLQLDNHAWLIMLYDVRKFIQMPDSKPICPPILLTGDVIGNKIKNFAWNPTIPNIFAYIDGHGSVSSFEFDQNSKQLKTLGKSDANNDHSSICWSLTGEQIVVVKSNGALALYDQNMNLKKRYPSAIVNYSFLPCIDVLWLSTHQFLLAFSENNSDENTNDDPFCQIMVTYDQDQVSKTQIYNALFFDASDVPTDIRSQYFFVRLNENKIIICGLSKSLKINVLGLDELNQDSLDIWIFADECRATVKGLTNDNNKRPNLTGMTIGLNSTLSISEGKKKLPPCPILLLSTSEGLLQVYYFIHKNLPNITRTPETIKQIEVPQSPLSLTDRILGTPSSLDSIPSFHSSVSSSSSTNGFSFSNFGFTSTTTTQSKGTTSTNNFNSNQQPSQTINKPLIGDLPKSTITAVFNNTTPAQPTPIKIVSNNDQSSSSNSNNKKILQMVNEFQLKLKSLEKPISKLPEPSINLSQSLENLMTTLNDMTKSFQTSMQSIKSMTSEHIESMTKIENALHQIKLSQKENLYNLLKDRELDPWTQSRLDSIKRKYDQLKHDLNVLLELTHTTIHDRSLSINDDETENEDFLPDLEISLNTKETMKQRIQKRILELGSKVSETEKDLEDICTKLNKNLLSNSTFTKTTMSSDRSYHSSDAQILSHLQATHPKVLQIHVPSAAIINLSSTIEQKKPSTNEITQSIPSSIQSSTLKQIDSPIIESDSFKNMLRLVRTSIDLFSGATSPEQLQELSSTIATSPLSSPQKLNMTSNNKTPINSKTTNPIKTSTILKPSNATNMSTNVLQTPAKSVTTSLPSISVTPATPAPQTISSDAALKFQQNKPNIQTPTDLSKTQTTLGDDAIRLLLNTTVSPSTNILPNQPIITSTSGQVVKTTLFGNVPNTSTAPIISQSPLSTAIITTTTVVTPVISIPSSIQSPFGAPLSPAPTVITSVQSTSPTTKPIMSTGFGSFGSRPTLGGNSFNLTPTTSSVLSFGSATATPNTGSLFGSAATSIAPTSTPFGSGFGATTTTTATTSAPSTSSFGVTTSSVPSPFGSGFSTPATTATTTSASTTGIFSAAATSPSSPFGAGFGSPTTTATTSAPSTGSFGSAFGSNTTATLSPFGGTFSPATSAPSASPFGGGFGGISTGTTFGGFGAAASTAPPPTTSSTNIFGSSGFGFTSSSPATSTAGTSSFGGGGGGGTSPFGSSFSGFNTQSNLSGQSTGFTFGGFGSQPSDATATHSTFGSFGSPSAAPQPSSPFGGSIFGGASGQSTSFGATTSSFGAPSTQSTPSASFTTYRK